MRWIALTGILLAISLGHANAETRNWIYEFGGDFVEDDDFTINQGNKEILIISGDPDPGKRFKFEARTEEWLGGEWVDIARGDIDDITIQDNAGSVNIEIIGDPSKDHTYGAAEVKAGDLTALNAPCTLWVLKTSSDVGELGPIVLDAVNATLDIGGDVLNPITTTSWSDTSSLLIGGNVNGDITLAGDLGALLEVGGNIAAHLQIDGNMLGQHHTYINVYGQLTTGGHLEITGDAINGASDGIHSWIKIRHMAGGARRIGPMIGILRNWAYPRVSVVG